MTLKTSRSFVTQKEVMGAQRPFCWKDSGILALLDKVTRDNGGEW